MYKEFYEFFEGCSGMNDVCYVDTTVILLTR